MDKIGGEPTTFTVKEIIIINDKICKHEESFLNN